MKKVMNTSASYQKIMKPAPKIEEEEKSTRPSILLTLNTFEEILKDLQFLTSLLCETLSKLNLPKSEPNDNHDLSDLVTSLYYMVPLLCDYSTINPQEIKLCLDSKAITEINVTLRTSQDDIINKIFEFPENGVNLNAEECRELGSLIIGALRDSASVKLKKQIKKLEEKAIQYGTLACKISANLKSHDANIIKTD